MPVLLNDRAAKDPVDAREGESQVEVQHERPGQGGRVQDSELGGQAHLLEVFVEDHLLGAGQLDRDRRPEPRRQPRRRQPCHVVVDRLQRPQLVLAELVRPPEVVRLDAAGGLDAGGGHATCAGGRQHDVGGRGDCPEERVDLGLAEHRPRAYCITKSVK